MSSKKPQLSVVLNVKNAAKILPRALESVSFATEIIVVDMESTDKTVEVAKSFNARIFSHPDVGYADPARNFGLSQAKFPWILVLDADEVVSTSLQHKILELISEPTADVYWLPRQNLFFGHWLNKAGWWPDHQPRLFRRGMVSWAVGVHRMPDIKGLELRLAVKPEWALLHTNYVSVDQFVAKLNQYTSLQAKEAIQEDPQSALVASQTSVLLKSYFDELLKRWLALRGIDDGLHGTAAAFLQANYELIKQLKLWQLAGFPPTINDQKDSERVIRQFQADLNYWLADWHLEHSSGLIKIFWWIRRRLKF
ncbi:MAG TPA: hypothetical protein DEP87_00090 [Candidatus Pacebacteria bacterium]|nr:hypothetical protein [Candidatus Paceibacterota bacterium]